MAIQEELKTAVFAYCREVEDEETLPPMTVAWDAAGGGMGVVVMGPLLAACWLIFPRAFKKFLMHQHLSAVMWNGRSIGYGICPKFRACFLV